MLSVEITRSCLVYGKDRGVGEKLQVHVQDFNQACMKKLSPRAKPKEKDKSSKKETSKNKS